MSRFALAATLLKTRIQSAVPPASGLLRCGLQDRLPVTRGHLISSRAPCLNCVDCCPPPQGLQWVTATVDDLQLQCGGFGTADVGSGSSLDSRSGELAAWNQPSSPTMLVMFEAVTIAGEIWLKQLHTIGSVRPQVLANQAGHLEHGDLVLSHHRA
jgi:hypothetical protein